MSRFDLLNDGEEISFTQAEYFDPYPNEKIRLRLLYGNERESLKNSIILNGILEPVLVMPSQARGRFIIISGHNRIDIAKELSIEVPYRIKANLSQEQADLMCIDSNLCKRQLSSLKTSELAYMFKIKNDSMKRQGKSDETSRKFFAKLEEDTKFSRRSIQLYIRLTYLTDELLKLVDDNRINFVVGVSISYLKQKEMDRLYDYISKNNYKITPKEAEELKKMSQSTEYIIDITSVLNKPNNDKFKPVKLTHKDLSQYIPSDQLVNSRQIILKALKLYYSQSV